MIRIKKLTMNYLENPIGISDLPQFAWVMESDNKNVKQISYQLQIAKNQRFEGIIYDSGETESANSAHIKPEGLHLETATKYFVRVKVKDNNGETSSWSEEAYFVTALVNEEWRAKFISAETKEDAKISKGTFVRKEFQIKGKVKSAYISTTALGIYKLYINGEKVSTDELAPGWTSYLKHLVYQTYDVSSYLLEGNNAIGAMLGAGWYKGRMGFVENRNHYGAQTAFLGQLIVEYEDGEKAIICSDQTWKGHDAPVIFSEIYDGETYDANKEIEGWNQVGLVENDWKPVNIVEFDKRVLVAQGGCKVKELDKIKANRIFTTPEGDKVIDFGQNLTGWIHFKAHGKKGDVVELNCFEVLDAAGNVYLDNLRGAKQRILYTFKKEETVEFHPNFTFQGFQYAKISQYPEVPVLESFTAFAVHSDMGQTGFFECSNPELNQLQHNILWGLKGNFLDIPTDCPQRNERLGWTGDAQIFCRTASYLMNTYNFMSKWLRDLEADQKEEGGVPHVIPDILDGKIGDDWLLSQGTHSSAAWADAAVINPWTLYLTYGDIEILKQQYNSMKQWIDFMDNNSKDCIWNYKLQFGDWVALDAEEGSYLGATPNELTATAYFAYSTSLFAKIARILNKEEATKYEELYARIKEKFQNTFFDSNGNMTAQTQTSHILALYFKLTPEKYLKRTVDNLVKLLEKENGHLVTGFVGTPYFCHALSENGRTKEAYELLLKDDFPSWLYQVKMGATTIWEHWDGIKPDGTMWSPDMNSFNHYAYGAIGEWLYRVVAGIEIDEEVPGYKHVIIQPHVGGDLKFVKAKYESVYGWIRSYWKLEGNLVTLNIEIPVNATATIRLEQAKEVISSDCNEFGQEEGIWESIVGSGVYTVQYRV